MFYVDATNECNITTGCELTNRCFGLITEAVGDGGKNNIIRFFPPGVLKHGDVEWPRGAVRVSEWISR